MSTISPENAALLSEIDDARPHAEGFAQLEKLLASSLEREDDDLGYAVRMRMTTWAFMIGDTESMLTSFGWCVGAHDRDPVRFPSEVSHHDLLFQYKWMAGRLLANPAYPLEQVSAIHEDMSFRYRAAGASQSGVLQSRFGVALDIGDLTAATRYREEREGVPEDEYSHCEACVRSEDALYFERLGDSDRALELYHEITEEGLTCGEEPEASQAQSLLLLLRTGALDEARRAHTASYRVARNSPDNEAILNNHIVFCAVTGNLGRGLSILEQILRTGHVDVLNIDQLFGTARAAGALLAKIVASGAGDTPVQGSDNPAFRLLWGERSTPGTAAELLPIVWASAQRIAEAFDRRNGTEEYSRRVAATQLLSAESYDLPLEQPTFVPPVSVPAPAEPENAAGVLAVLRDSHVGDGAEAFATVLRLCLRGLSLVTDEDEPRTVSALYGAAIQAFVKLERFEEAAEYLGSRITFLRSAGEEAQAAIDERFGLGLFGREPHPLPADLIAAAEAEGTPPIVRARLLLDAADQLLRQNDSATALPLAREAMTFANAPEEPTVHYPAMLLVGFSELDQGNAAIADELFATIAESTGPAAPSMTRALALRMRAQIASGSEEFARGAALADELIALSLSAQDRAGAITAAELAAQLLSREDEDAAAAGRLSFALDQAAISESDRSDELEFQLGRYLHWSGSQELAIEHLDRAFTLASEKGVPGNALGEILYWLANAARASEEYGLVYSALSHSIALTTEEFPEVAARNGLMLGQFLTEHSHPAAVEVLEAALGAAIGTEELSAITTARHSLGRARAAAGDAAGLDDLAEVERSAREQGADWLIADVTDSIARALAQLGRPEEAVPTALRAADAYADCGDDNAAALAEVFAARTLGERGRGEDAVAIYHAAISRLPLGSPPFIGINLELGAFLEGLGRHEEAAQARSAAGDPGDEEEPDH